MIDKELVGWLNDRQRLSTVLLRNLLGELEMGGLHNMSYQPSR